MQGKNDLKQKFYQQLLLIFDLGKIYIGKHCIHKNGIVNILIKILNWIYNSINQGYIIIYIGPKVFLITTPYF